MRSAAAEEDEEEDAAQGCVGGFRLGRRVRRRVNFHPTRQQASSLPVEEDDAERESPPVPAPAVAAAAAGAVGGGGGAIWDGSGSMLLLAVVVVPVPVLWLGLTPSTVITGFFLACGFGLSGRGSGACGCVESECMLACSGICLLCCRLGLAVFG